MNAQPGSFSWLLTAELRLSWRGFATMFGRRGQRHALVAATLAMTALHLLAWPAIAPLAPYMQADTSASSPLQTLTIAVFLTAVFLWLVSQGLLGATRTLFDRSDLDLLLASPLPSARIFAASAVSIAASSFGSVAMLLLPIANMGALTQSPLWLSAYPMLAALALTGTAAGLAIALALFALVGPKRARTVSQISAAFIAGTFVLGIQALALLPDATRDALGTWLAGFIDPASIAATSMIAMPVAALRGGAIELLVVTTSAAALFALSVYALGPRLARASVAAAGAPASGSSRRPRKVNFINGLMRSLRRKEWRLIYRDPNLFAQLSLQIIYTVPVAIVLLRGSSSIPTEIAIAPLIVVIAAQVAASLAWIAVSGEEAPELIAAAPVAPAAVNQGKLTAISVPVAAILAGPLAGLALISADAAIWTAIFAAAAGTSTALLNLWHPLPGKRRGMLRRHQQSKLIAMIEHLIAMTWAVAVVMALMGTMLTLIPVAVALAIVATARKGSVLATIRTPSTSRRLWPWDTRARLGST